MPLLILRAETPCVPLFLPHNAAMRKRSAIFFGICLLVGLLCGINIGHGEERIWLQAEINGKPVRLLFDTGSSVSMLTESAANRLGLKVHMPINGLEEIGAPETIIIGISEKCSLLLGTNLTQDVFTVIRFPKQPGFDGFVGWQGMKNSIIFIEPSLNRMTILKALPKDISTWIKFPISAKQEVLALEEPFKGRHKPVIMLDTGRCSGVALLASGWREWKAVHSGQPSTLTGYYTPEVGVVVKEEVWAERFSLGPLELSDVPIMEANQAEVQAAASPYYQATLGLAALHGVEIIVDGRHRVVYFRPTTTPARPYEHNRLGAVFVADGSGNKDHVASVIEGSPAYQAGIRNGDVLLEIDHVDIEKANAARGRFDEPAGTKMELTLKRGDRVFTTSVELKNILGPASSLPESTK
ncbi:MAG: hypothetical protein JWR26_2541 [Pedosphaera sp.]|nr:hypothetical protein [Pedosphaera sp.]